MEPWETQLKSSPAYLKAKEIISQVDSVDIKQYSVEDQNYLERAKLVCEQALSIMDECDPRLINKTALNSLSSSLANVASYLDTWLQNQSQEYIAIHVQNELDSSLNHIPMLTPSVDVPGARSAIASLRRSVARNRQLVDETINEIKQKGSLADNTIDAKVAEVEEKFANINQDVTKLEADLDIVRDTSAKLASEQQTAFNKSETDRNTAFSKLLSEKQKELDEALKVLSEQAQSSVTSLKDGVEADVKAAETAKTRIEEILGIVSEEALVGDYSKNASGEKNTANIWRRVASGSLLGAIGIAVWLAASVGDSTKWQHIVGKIAIIISLSGFATYAAKQSSEHRTAQRDAEQMALQLKALKPYLTDLDNPDKRDQLLADIADRLFGQRGSLVSSGKEGADNPILLAQLAEALLEVVKRSK